MQKSDFQKLEKLFARAGAEEQKAVLSTLDVHSIKEARALPADQKLAEAFRILNTHKGSDKTGYVEKEAVHPLQHLVQGFVAKDQSLVLNILDIAKRGPMQVRICEEFPAKMANDTLFAIWYEGLSPEEKDVATEVLNLLADHLLSR